MSLVNLPGRKKKTPSAKTFGVLLFGVPVFVLSIFANAECKPQGVGELAKVDRIYDGDTLRLTDGRHVRLLGVNTPEVDHGDKKTGQALGEDARNATEAFFKKDKTVRLFYDVQRADRYNRTLAHVYDSKGSSLSGYLLRNGFGFQVAVPPNLSMRECLHDEENIARRKQLGVWSNAGWRAKPAASLKMADTGFSRIQGRVIEVREEKSIWLELEGALVIKISPSDKKNFPVQNWQSWKGKRIEARGWITASATKDEQNKTGSKAKRPFKSLILQPRIPEALEFL